MPKIVDHQQRKEKIAEAAWTVIREKGIKGASVRNIAQACGLSLGALRHYFTTQEELLIFTMNSVKERAEARIAYVYEQPLPMLEKILGILYELLPTDENKRAEMEVWFEFTAHLRSENASFDAEHDGILSICQTVIQALATHDVLLPNLSISLEIERLYALIDGLALHALLDSKRLPSEQMKQTVAYHLQQICRAE
ncbi:putative transcriptional regulator [Fictibacillus macauensis ZFHKF-1]|uniref:Putative transcriptional regulator n=1 Tax=Fictibacillus macauensis ZFHKF-1 TaxID=1196324 RepID=I8AFN1_9BACL|nr:TetR/AcrR family transcriptional regulator [Fictibacillus macauensis]EIT84442.1 putative transcriptional regulator [Fictibacillus macauensis ZFHKF-1]